MGILPFWFKWVSPPIPENLRFEPKGEYPQLVPFPLSGHLGHLGHLGSIPFWFKMDAETDSALGYLLEYHKVVAVDERFVRHFGKQAVARELFA